MSAYFTILPSAQELGRFSLSLLNSTIFAPNRRTVFNHPSLAEFDVDGESGFFPRDPLPPLPRPFDIWEAALNETTERVSLGEEESDAAIEKRTSGEVWRRTIKSWPVIETDVLHTDPRLLQKAHQVLAWLVHFYVHSIPPCNGDASIIVPKSIAVPLVAVSRVLGIAPVLTFADTVLWNCEPVDKSCPISLENIRPKYTFSDTDDERSFYVASARAEIRGIEILRIIDAFHSLPNMSDFTSISRVSRDLARLTKAIEDISEIIQSVRADCDPHVFYWEIRPWFEGSDAKGPQEPGWVYEGVDMSEKLDLSGPSAGQSTVMHALDIFLGIDHKLQYRRSPAPSPENKRADRGFMARMRRYMPGKHRQFLEYLAAAPRQLRDQAQETTALKEPYDAAVMALKKLRDMHMRIACLYIVTMSRSAPSDRPGCPVLAAMERQRGRAPEEGPIRGTGGTELSLLLKAGRDATRRAALKGN